MGTVSQSANSPSSSSSTSRTTPTISNGDTLFEPSVEMMVNDFDDERTLEEEEALAAIEAEDPSAELSSLQRERDMPIEELLALYNCQGRTDDQTIGGGSEDTQSNRPRSSSSHSSNNENESEEQNGLEKDDEVSDLRKLYPETFSSGEQRLLRTLSRPQSEEEEDDGDYSPDEDDFKKTIMVGSEFQAVIPEELCKYGDALPYENEDKLVWDPTKLLEQDVVKYEQKSSQLSATMTSTSAISSSSSSSSSVSSIPTGNHLRDDEQNLYLLLQCGHNVEEALRRRRIGTVAASPTDSMSQWSEEECRNFENGLRIYGKDFHTIQQLKVKTRSVGELVQFYYLWKKTERHDVFANKARLEKKKYSLHPGLTDYMDRFLEEQECNGSSAGGSSGGGGSGGGSGTNAAGSGFIGGLNSGTGTSASGPSTAGSGNCNTTGSNNGSVQIGIRERSSSPSVNCLIYANYRRQRSISDHSQSITDPLATSDNDLFINSVTPTSLKPKDSHTTHYNLNTSKL